MGYLLHGELVVNAAILSEVFGYAQSNAPLDVSVRRGLLESWYQFRKDHMNLFKKGSDSFHVDAVFVLLCDLSVDVDEQSWRCFKVELIQALREQYTQQPSSQTNTNHQTAPWLCKRTSLIFSLPFMEVFFRYYLPIVGVIQFLLEPWCTKGFCHSTTDTKWFFPSKGNVDTSYPATQCCSSD